MKDKQKIIELSNKIKLPLCFCADLIPDQHRLTDTAKRTSDRQAFAMSAAPLREAFGENGEEVAWTLLLDSGVLSDNAMIYKGLLFLMS